MNKRNKSKQHIQQQNDCVCVCLSYASGCTSFSLCLCLFILSLCTVHTTKNQNRTIPAPSPHYILHPPETRQNNNHQTTLYDTIPKTTNFPIIIDIISNHLSNLSNSTYITIYAMCIIIILDRDATVRCIFVDDRRDGTAIWHASQQTKQTDTQQQRAAGVASKGATKQASRF